MVSVQAACGGLTVTALLICAVRLEGRFRLAALCLFCVLGLFVGGRIVVREASEAALVARYGPDTFSTVRIEIEDGWSPRPDGGWRLKARCFEIVEDARVGHVVRKPLHVILYDEPPEMRFAARVVARGFLRKMDGGAWVLSIKSSSLVETEGIASPLDPRNWNRNLASLLDAAAADSERAREGSALTQALVLGRGGLVPWEVIDLYQRGGTYHLLVFSGVQIAMMAALARWVLIRLRWRRAADVSLVLICALMPRFVGSDPSVSRSALMIGLLLGCWMWERPTDASNLLFVSALVRLVMVPDELCDPGFALTYSATAGILLVGRSLAKGRGRVVSALAYGVGAELGTTPFTLFFFNRATLGGSMVTLLVTPILTLMLGAGFFATIVAAWSPGLCRFVLELVGWLNEPVLAINRFVAEEARLSFVAASPALPVMVAAVMIAMVAAAMGRRGGIVVVIVALLVPLGSSWRAGLPDRSVEADVHFLDVGQGDAILAVSRGHAMLVDGGGSISNPAYGARVLVPLLVERGVRRIDTVVLSHPHPDHCGGLLAVLRHLDVGRLVLSRRHLATPCGSMLTDVALDRSIPIVGAESTAAFRLGDFHVDTIVGDHRYRRAWENNSSVLLRLTSGGRSLLLTGDIEREAERVLLETRYGSLRSDVLKVPHHGSRSSTGGLFVEAVRPRIAVISCGVRNRFGHPHEEPLSTLEANKVRVTTTATSGTVCLRFAGGHLFTHREFDSPRP